MNNQLAQYGAIVAANGSTLSYNSSRAMLEVKDAPRGHRHIIDAMMQEISHFDDTASYIDGVACFCVAEFLDDVPNPIPKKSRLDILEALGIMHDGRYIHQVLMLQKNNRSWHKSGIANQCEFFGTDCTHRGLHPDPNRKGRVSLRQPNEYHQESTKGIIAREQLVTPNLEKVFRSIPNENLVSAQPITHLGNFNLKKFKDMPIEDKLRFMSELQGAM